MTTVYSITYTNRPGGKYEVQAFTPYGWTPIGRLKKRKKAAKLADLYAEATGRGVRVEDVS